MKISILRGVSNVCLLLIVTAFAQMSMGQNANTGEIKGTVTDSTGAVVSDVKVTITNVATGVSMTSTTNADGIYDAPSVPTGPYTVTFSKAGFGDFVRKGVTVELQTIAVDGVLKVGNTSEEVTVVADVPLVQTESSDQHVNFDTKDVVNAPIVGGVWFSELTAVLPGHSGGGTGNRGGGGGDGVAVNGTQAYSANYLIEGTTATDTRDGNASNNYPPIDAISEVSVNTANAGAQYGNGLLSFNVNLKSGTNRWHGSAFEFIQNDALESRNYFNAPISLPGFSGTGCTKDKHNPNLCKKGPQRWNEFGGSIGGPIVKNKLFFYFTYQRNPVQSSALYTTTVPTEAMRNGDFTDPRLHATIYDKNSCSGNCARAPLNGGSNVLLPGQIDPVAAKILSYIPHPTDPNALTNNFSAIVGTPTLSQWYVGKIDYQITSNNRLSGSFLELPVTLTFNADALCNLGFDCTRSTPNNRNQSGQITETWTISPSMINEFRIGATREHDKYAPPTYGKGFPQKIGLQPAYGANSPVDVFPNISITGNSSGVTANTFIGGGVHADLVEDMYEGSDVVTLIRGKHSVKIGGELDKQFQHDTTWGDSSSGDFTFTGVGTRSGSSPDPRNGGATGSGIPFADFLLGDVGTWNIFNGEPSHIHTWIGSLFVNDDYKITPKLTLNLGLRYQHQTGWTVAGKMFGTFDPTLPNPGSFPPGALGAIRYGGVHGSDTVEPGVNAWSPRIGFAWAPRDKWSVRGSYGVFQSPRGTELYAHDNYPATLNLGFNPHGFIGNGSDVAFQLQTGPPPGSLVVPTLATLTPDQFNFQVVSAYAPKLPLQYVQQFLLGVQHELPWNHLIDVSYVHTKGTHLNFATDQNQVPVNQLSNPSNTGNFSPLRPYPQYTSILAHDFTGWSNYDALQLRLVKRLSYGVSYQINYAFSRYFDTGTGDGHDQSLDVWQIARDPRANYGPSQTDAPHNLNGSLSYEVPFGAGRMHALHGVADQIFGGWRATTIFTARSGIPFTPIVSSGNNDLALSGSVQCFCGYSVFANRTGSGRLSNPSINQWFDPSAFTDPTSNGSVHAFGNSGRNILRGPKFVDVDLSLGKSFRIREGMSFELRADSYNALNHPQFYLPDNNILSSTAGRITTTTNFGGPGRIIQMGGRFSF